jgi:hypothetical protein
MGRLDNCIFAANEMPFVSRRLVPLAAAPSLVAFFLQFSLEWCPSHDRRGQRRADERLPTHWSTAT